MAGEQESVVLEVKHDGAHCHARRLRIAEIFLPLFQFSSLVGVDNALDLGYWSNYLENSTPAIVHLDNG